MNRSGKPHALLSTARIANVPSVISNVWVGIVLGWLASGPETLDIPWKESAFLIVSGICLYIGGNFLNDWMDRNWDVQHRPERALPRGLFTSGTYVSIAFALLLAGTIFACTVRSLSGIVAAAIVLFIVIYTVWHKKTPWAVIPMGICRALLPVMGSMAFFSYADHVWPIACGLLFYIMGLSLSARYESMSEPPRIVGVLSRALLLGTAIFCAWSNKGLHLAQWLIVMGALPYLLWTTFCLRFRNHPVPKLVSGLLAGIPLMDWIVLLPVGLMIGINSAEGWNSLAIASLIVPPVAFFSAHLLQKVAPAT